MRERQRLTCLVNETLWDKETHFYYDLWQDGRRSGVKSIAAYWALLADIIPATGRAAMAHDIAVTALENEVKFFADTGTLWENYAPEMAQRGSCPSDCTAWSICTAPFVKGTKA